MNIKGLWEQGCELFSKRSSLLLLWQETADNFYPERADFTIHRVLGTDFASGMMTSYPVLCRRDLQDQIGQMLRPTAKPWFHAGVMDPDRENNDAKRWLQRADVTMQRAMYDPLSQFTRACKEGDGDFSCFGQCVITVEVVFNKQAGQHLLYRNWHLRDVAWTENEHGQIGTIWRKWKVNALTLVRLFGKDKVHAKVNRAIEKGNELEEFDCWHMVCEADMYSKDARGKPYWSLYYDEENKHLMEETAVWQKGYVIPRWQTVSGSQYAFSPAVVAALPEARLIQSMTYTLLEAGEKFTSPPMIAVEQALRSDIALYAGGITYVDMDYDEKTGEVLRPLGQDKSGMPIGFDMQRDSRALINQCFYLNKLTLPQRGPEMTAYQVSQMIQQYIRDALPLFEPMEDQYNAGLWNETYGLLKRYGAFGSPLDMPESLQQTTIRPSFVSPLHDAIEQAKGQLFGQAIQVVTQAQPMDPTAMLMLDTKTTIRDVLDGIGIPAKWVRSELEMQQIDQKAAQQAKTQELLTQMQQGADVGATIAGGQKQASEAVAV